MARINSGINPKYLSDQHLIAESVEITMITGALRKDGYMIKGSIPDEYCLGKGHINFFKPRIVYLWHRLEEVNNEMKRRGFKPGTKIDLFEFNSVLPSKPFEPKFEDTCLVRQRIIERLKEPKKAKQGFHRYYGNPIDDMDQFCEQLKKSKLYYV